MRILHLIESFDAIDCARQLHLLGADATASPEICCLGPDSQRTQALRDAGVAVHPLRWTRWIDPSVVWNLRRIVREARPQVIHVWRLPALRLLAVAAFEWLPRVVLSEAQAVGEDLPWWDRWLMRQVHCADVPPGIVDLEAPPADASDSSSGVTVVCASPLERAFGVRNAIWAFDIIRQLFPDARLQIVGAGSQEPNLRSLATGLQNDAVEFVAQSNLAPRSDVVWIPSIADCGGSIALDAMAQGRAVIASDVPCLRDLIDDGVTGFLVPPGDVVALSRRTRALLADHALRKRLGHAARESVRRRFPAANAVERWREVYRLVAA